MTAETKIANEKFASTVIQRKILEEPKLHGRIFIRISDIFNHVIKHVWKWHKVNQNGIKHVWKWHKVYIKTTT